MTRDYTISPESGGVVADGAQFRFRRPPFFTSRFVLVLVTAPIGMIIPWLGAMRSGADWLPGLMFITVTTISSWAAACGVRVWLRPKLVPTIELHRDGAVLPLSSGTKRSRRVAYEDMKSLNVFGVGRLARMLVGTTRRNFVYPVAHFEGGASGLAVFRSALRARIAGAPDGPVILRGIDERDARGLRVAQQPRRVTLVLIVLLVAAFSWTWLSRALDGPFDLVHFGANAPVLIAEGEWYRLLSASLLHNGWLHLCANAISIYALGTVLERLVGPWRFLCVVVTAAGLGALASALAARAALSVGASAVVFGLLGAHALINWRCRISLPGGFSQPLRMWLIVLGLNAVLPFVAPVIDWAAHVGGFIGGTLTAAVVSPVRDAELLGRPPGLWLKTATVGLAAIFVAAIGQAVVNAFEGGEQAKQRVAEAFIEQQSSRPIALRAIASGYATKPNVTESELAIAERAALRAIRLDAANATFIDTLAMVYYRGRRFDAATIEQRRAVRLDDRGEFVSHMGRFLDARLTESGPFALGPVAPDSIEVRLEWPHLFLDLAADVEQGLDIYALDKRNGHLAGTARLLLGPGVKAGRHSLAFSTQARPLQDNLLIVAYVDGGGCACPPGSIRFKYVPSSRGLQQLPAPLQN